MNWMHGACKLVTLAAVSTAPRTPPDAGTAVLDDPLHTLDAAIVTLRRATLQGAYDRVRHAAGIELERAASIVLARIAECGPVRVGDLADRLGLDQSTASRHVARLEADGYVERKRDPSDGRATRCSVTPEGSDVVARLAEARRRLLERLLAEWSHDDRLALAALLPRFVADLLAAEPTP